MSEQAQQYLQQGVALAKAGQRDQAFGVLQQAVRLDPRNETIWLWLSSVARNDQERVFCLRQILAINPQNDLAIKGLQAMGIQANPPAATQGAGTAAPSQNVQDTPLVAQERLVKIQPALDEFLRTYNPGFYTPLEIEWVQKDGRRYGEGAARRLKRSVYVAGGLGAIAALILLVILGSFILSTFRGEEEAAAGRNTLTPSFTPSVTPTVTPVENTPLPPNIPTSTPIAVAQEYPRGNALAVRPTGTAVYPLFAGSIQKEMSTAVAYFSQQDYAAVAEISEGVRTSQNRSCFAETYYYEAMGLAKEGGSNRLSEADALLREGLNAERDSSYVNTCKNSSLLVAGQCFVAYQRAVQNPRNINTSALNQAIDLCSAALADDPALVQAADTLAQAYILQGDSNSLNRAFSALEAARDAQPQNNSNLVLILDLADVQIARGDYQGALVWIETALYIDPVSEAALQKRVNVNFKIAEQATPGSQQAILRYGNAAIAAEAYLFWYPGAPMGHAKLAEARVREGNPDRALRTLNRLIEAQNTLDAADRDNEALQLAYTLRAGIYLDRREWQAAFDDLERLLVFEPDNLIWIELHKNAALALDEYETALTDLETLRDSDATRSDWVIEQARLLTRTCQYNANFDCNERLVTRELLTDEFIATLAEGSAERADALAYRAEADFAAAQDDLETAVLQQLVTQVQEALAIRETGADYYLLGRIYSALEELRPAASVLEWVVYWDQDYEYPFGRDAREALENIQEQLEEAS
ncbi:MAG: hypothetical protein H6673_08580 [Anaerolineales bacterium]|nr:hypothetical protein [Anaerolineales bacterium]